ncbi:hypothetical protein TeGR_g12489 [Tetraparma gracilis]|uniref:26S proteasome non-ATPase regulatory subunit 5 n=1 Tax=Tetraparma gracilis TaxID=2962635 RepID=A0ABQ6MV14_9STRA|nr:hypothetical protein TeGR_g12489 [Tetraparma gracilis]
MSLLPPLLHLLSTHAPSHLPALLPPLLPSILPLLPSILLHHLHSDITPFLLHLLPPLLSSPYSPPPRSRLLKFLPAVSFDQQQVKALLVDRDPPLPADAQVFLLLLSFPRVPLVPGTKSDIVARFVASSYPSTSAEYARCGRSDGGILLPGLLLNAAISTATSGGERGAERQFHLYLSAFISGRGVAPDDTPLLVSALTAPAFATALVRLLGEVPAAQVQAPRVLAVVRPCMALGVLGELKPAEGKRLAKYVVSGPLTNLLTELLDADAFDAAGEAFTALLEWCYSLLSLPALKHPQSCVRLQNLLLHHLLPPPPDPGDPNPSVGALAAAEVMLRSASQLGDIDAGLLLVEIGAIGPFEAGSEELAKKRELMAYLMSLPQLFESATYSTGDVALVGATVDPELLKMLLKDQDPKRKQAGLAVLVNKIAGGEDLDLAEFGGWGFLLE